MFTPEQILQIAQELQPRIPELLPSDRAEAIDRQLTQLIAQYNSGDSVAQTTVAQAILDLLDEEPKLSPYLIPSNSANYNKRLTPLFGNPAPIPSSLIYRCPECDYTTKIPFQGMTPDPCPNHSTAKLQPL